MAMSEGADIWHSALPAGLHLGAIVQARPWSTTTTTRKRLATVDYCLFPLRWELWFLHWQLWCLTSGPENDLLFMGWLSWMEAEDLYGLIECSVFGVLSSGGLLVSFPGLWISVSLVKDPFFCTLSWLRRILFYQVPFFVCFQGIWYTVSGLVALWVSILISIFGLICLLTFGSLKAFWILAF